jgi:hypothetical protein
MMIKCSTWKRRKRKTETKEIKANVSNSFFYDQGTIESVITFRIDSRTIKRKNLWLSGYRIPLGDMILAYVFRNLVC